MGVLQLERSTFLSLQTIFLKKNEKYVQFNSSLHRPRGNVAKTVPDDHFSHKSTLLESSIDLRAVFEIHQTHIAVAGSAAEE